MICPRDSRPGAAYVDCLSTPDAGHSTVMLSYTWSYKLRDIADALTQFCTANQLDPAQTFVWMCCVCINQHRVVEMQAAGRQITFSQFEHEFGSRVAGIGQLVAMMSPWHRPLYISRCWCLFELFTALHVVEHCTVHITMPSEQAAEMQQALLSGNINKMWKALTSLRSADAQAYSKSDQENIMHAIERGPGFTHLDHQLSKHLKEWIMTSCQVHWDLQSSAVNSPTEQLAELASGFGLLLRTSGALAQAQTVLCQAKKIRLETNTLQTQDGAKLLKLYGSVLGQQGDIDAELNEWAEACNIHNKLGTLCSSLDGALLLRGIADVNRQKGNLTQAFNVAKQAKQAMANINALEATADGAKVFRTIGNIQRDFGNLEEALASYDQSKSVRKACETYATPDGAQLQMDIAAVQMRQGNVQAAMVMLVEAKELREQTDTVRTPSGALLLKTMGDAKELLEDHHGALELYNMAKEIYIEVGALMTLNGERLLDRIRELKAVVCTKQAAVTAELEPEFSGSWRQWQAGYNPQNAQARTMHLNASIARIQAKLHARANKTSTNDQIDKKDGDSSVR